MLRTVSGERGMFTAGEVRAAVRGDGPHFQRSRLVSVENTTNSAVARCGAPAPWTRSPGRRTNSGSPPTWTARG